MIRKTLLILALLAALMLVACTPAVSPPTGDGGAEPTVTSAPEVNSAPEVADAAPEEPTAAPAAATEVPAEEPAFVPTSRGTQLAATDPNSIVLASGKPQLIEFFAFW